MRSSSVEVEMENVHPLKSLLQTQLASDASVITHLPHVLLCLSTQCFEPSPHLSEWITRLNSLIQSKDSGARWAGLCLALQTSILNKSIMIESAQNWITTALPLLSKSHIPPVTKVAVRLILHIFTAAMDMAEFQRQLSIPNVPRFCAALINLVDESSNCEVKILSMYSLARLIGQYPTAHRSSRKMLSDICLKYLNGSTPTPLNAQLIKAASVLYTTLPCTGGKVAKVSLWREAVDETLSSAWGSFNDLRTTFTSQEPVFQQRIGRGSDPVSIIPLAVDRLRCCIQVLCDFLRSTIQRPASIPLGALVKFTNTLLQCTTEDHTEGISDYRTRAMELPVIPTLWEFGCDLINHLTKCVHRHITPYTPRLMSSLAYHLEQRLTPGQRLSFLRTLVVILKNSYNLDSYLIPNRMARALLPLLGVILSTQLQHKSRADSTQNSTGSKKGKKRARGYEGDEVFRVSRDVICPTVEDGEVLLVTLDALEFLKNGAMLDPAMQSVSSRVILSSLLSLSQLSPAALSSDLSLHHRMTEKLVGICVQMNKYTGVLSSSMALVMQTSLTSGLTTELAGDLEALLHPRLPPLVRSLPHIEALSLFRHQESQEEGDFRERLGFSMSSDRPPLEPESVTRTNNTNAANGLLGESHIQGVQLRHEVASSKTMTPPSHMAAPTITANNHDTSQILTLHPPKTIGLTTTFETTSPSAPSSMIPQPVVQSPRAVQQPLAEPIPAILSQLDEEDEMPSIDMDSDSD